MFEGLEAQVSCAGLPMGVRCEVVTASFSLHLPQMDKTVPPKLHLPLRHPSSLPAPSRD